MAFCFEHNQMYDEESGGFCIYCGDPKKKMKIKESNKNQTYVPEGKELLNESA